MCIRDSVIIVLKYLYQDLLANIVHLRGQCIVTQKACGVLKQIADLTIVPEALPCPHKMCIRDRWRDRKNGTTFLFTKNFPF